MQSMTDYIITSDYTSDYTVLLMHMDGSNGSTSFIDSSIYNHTIVNTNNLTHSTSQKKFGLSSLEGNNVKSIAIEDYDTFNFGIADLTIEFQAYITTSSRGKILRIGSLHLGVEGSPWNAPWCEGPFGSGVYGIGVPRNQWCKWTFVRNSGRCILWVNNTIHINSTANSGAVIAVSALDPKIYIGAIPYYTTQGLPTGCYLDELRISKGIALYTLSSPPTTQTDAFLS